MDKKVLAGVGIGGAIALFLGGQAVASHMAAKEVDKAIADMSDFVDVEYKKVNHSLLGRGTSVQDVVITPVLSGEPITVNEVVLYDFQQKDDVPTYMKFAVNGVSLKDSAETSEMFADLGYEKDVAANFATEYEYEADGQTMRLKKFEVGADNVGDIEMNFQVSNVSLDEESLASFPFSLFGAEFHNAKITYKDDSFIERIFETTAEEQGISVKEAKENAIADLEADFQSGESGLPEEFVNEMKNFIQDPDRFTITFNPEQPVPMTSFMAVEGPEDVIELLNVRFES